MNRNTHDPDALVPATGAVGLQDPLERVRALGVAVLGDVLDALGLYDQVLPPGITGVAPGLRLAGRAMPVLVLDVFGPQATPFGRLTEALDALTPGEVYIARTSGAPCAAWGEILTGIARERGAAGAVIEGYHRDTDGILAQEWPVFSRGACAADSAVRARVEDYGVEVRIGAVTVRPGDLVVGDRDGVVVVPKDVEEEAIERAEAKIAAEHEVRQSIRGGMSATEAYAAHGVL